MSVNSKPDFHPDAESLNAFAEEALGAQDRDAMMAHLAECGRCREIVFLAREAAEEMVPELKVAAAACAPGGAARKEPWFRSWRFAWVPVGALAALVTVAYVVHVRHKELAAEQALVAAVRTAEIAKAEVKPPMEMQAAPPAIATQTLAGKMTSSAAPTVAVKAVTPMAAPPAVGAMASSNSAGVALSAGAVRASAGLEAAVHEPEAQVAERQEAIEHASAAYESSVTAEKRLRASAGGPAKEMQSRGLTAAAPALARDAIASETSEDRSVTFSKVKRAVLPSGLAAIGTATNPSCTVAVDAAGGVFVRADAGRPWESVAKQWSGRAVAVRRGTAAVIELVNDRGQVWVSTDGRTWAAK